MLGVVKEWIAFVSILLGIVGNLLGIGFLYVQVGSMKGEIGEIRGEIGEVRGEIGEIRGEMRGEFRVLHSKIDALKESNQDQTNALKANNQKEHRTFEKRLENLEREKG